MYTAADLEPLIDQLPENRRATAASLVRKAQRWTPSQAQAKFISDLVRQAKGEQSQVDRPQVEISQSLDSILALFATASNKLKYPSFMIKAGENIVRLSVAGAKSKAPGTINVTDERKGYGNNTWYGRVGLDGKFSPSRDGQDFAELVPALREFAADPAAKAAEFGKWRGFCCFCGRTLDDEKSTDVGYGPVCAKNYGLPWGGKKGSK